MRNRKLISVLAPVLLTAFLLSGCLPIIFGAILDQSSSQSSDPAIPSAAPATETTPISTIVVINSPDPFIEPTEDPLENPSEVITIGPTNTPATTPVEPVDSISVHFIDVGQGDSILIKAGAAAMLIDTGNPGDSSQIIDYLNEQGVSSIKYLVGTHPHADHIGGMADIIDAFTIGTILMPRATNDTETFENVLDAVDRKGMEITAPKVGSEYYLANVKCIILAPNSSSYNDLNDNSLVIRLVFGETSFLFTGDAETSSEDEMLADGYDLESTLLKVGHHGSDSSSSARFLAAVQPRYAVISVGSGNTYGHPALGTLQRLSATGAEIYRTDLSGTIIATSDGTSIILDKSASPIKTTAPPTVEPTVKPTPKPTIVQKSVTVYITKSGEKYHRSGCRYLAKSKIAIKLADALSRGYTPCKVCKPPTK